MASKKLIINLNSKLPKFNKTIHCDSDKSISIRSFIIGAISNGISTISNALESEDVLASINCLRKLGVIIKKKKIGTYEVYGKGLGSLYCKKKTILNCENSGTLSRLLIGCCATNPNLDIIVKGDSSLNKRSMKELIVLMESFGATFYPKNKNYFPLRLISSEIPLGISYKANESAQLKSACILSALNSYGNSKIIIDKKIASSRDHTENMLSSNSKSLKIKDGRKKIITIFGKRNLDSFKINVPNDPSSAAFFTALTILNKNSKLKIKNVGLNKTRIGFYELLKKHNAKINFKNLRTRNGEKIGDIYIQSSKLKPIKANRQFYPKTTDEYLILSCCAALTKGVSVFEGIGPLANKESSRAHEMKKILKQVGIKCIVTKDKMKIYGSSKIKSKGKKIILKNIKDHRLFMSSFVLSLITGVKAKLFGFETVFTSSPNFLKIMKFLGARYEKN